jgi:alanine-glyoxylate transaminase/serine-glyoxylate transaminase/serine-pyruvate transaminase
VVTHVRAPIGGRPALDEVEAALKAGGFKLMTVTHVDTSTGVLTDVPALAELGRRYGALVIVDGVCSVAGEALRMAEWGVDVALTASQKAIGTPPGLALLVAGPRAMEAFRRRKTPVASYYADWANWLPIMEAYEARKPAYFGTPAVNLVAALNVSLGLILAEGVEARFARHAAAGAAGQAAIAALGLGQVPLAPEIAAHTMTAPRFPQGVNGADFLKRVGAAGVTLAGGLHPQIRAEYFRIGHMGSVSQGDLLATIGAIEAGLAGCGYAFERGAGVAAAAKRLIG